MPCVSISGFSKCRQRLVLVNIKDDKYLLLQGEPDINDHFIVSSSCSADSARRGRLKTAHGEIKTPVFLPVGSQGTVKTLAPDELVQAGATIILANTYHLYLRPGIDVIEKFGGLHKFMGWNGPVLTDSGGYQVYSLSPLCKLTEDGAVFRSHIDGSEHVFTPEAVVDYQQRLGVDISMVLDECAPIDAGERRIRDAMERTHSWARRCKSYHTMEQQHLFAIVQGGAFPHLRRESARILSEMDFPGYAVGGLSLGESKETTWQMVAESVGELPDQKPRYLMGVGSPEDIVEGVSLGIDIFDSVLPTRVARNGALFTREGRKNIKKASFKLVKGPVEDDCDCYTCRNFSAGYLHHLFRSEELLAYRLATIHNVRFICRLIADIGNSLENGTFSHFKKEFLGRYRPTDEKARIEQKKRWIKGQQPEI